MKSACGECLFWEAGAFKEPEAPKIAGIGERIGVPDNQWSILFESN
jgi:hypothetical protein